MYIIEIKNCETSHSVTQYRNTCVFIDIGLRAKGIGNITNRNDRIFNSTGYRSIMIFWGKGCVYGTEYRYRWWGGLCLILIHRLQVFKLTKHT